VYYNKYKTSLQNASNTHQSHASHEQTTQAGSLSEIASSRPQMGRGG